MADSFVLVDTLDEVRTNVIRFNDDLRQAVQDGDDLFLDFMSDFKQWYYFRDLDKMGPSKFVGYKNMTSFLYKNKKGRGADGRDTERKLKDLRFEETSDPSLKRKLQRLGAFAGRRISIEAKVNVIPG